MAVCYIVLIALNGGLKRGGESGERQIDPNVDSTNAVINTGVVDRDIVFYPLSSKCVQNL